MKTILSFKSHSAMGAVFVSDVFFYGNLLFFSVETSFDVFPDLLKVTAGFGEFSLYKVKFWSFLFTVISPTVMRFIVVFPFFATAEASLPELDKVLNIGSPEFVFSPSVIYGFWEWSTVNSGLDGFLEMLSGYIRNIMIKVTIPMKRSTEIVTNRILKGDDNNSISSNLTSK